MDLSNVITFFAVGFGMEMLPRLGFAQGGSDRGALWLMVMGAVMMAIGGAYLARMAWETLPWEKYLATVRAIIGTEESESPAGALATRVDAKTTRRV